MLKRFLCALSVISIMSAQQAPMSRSIELLIGKAHSLEARGRLDLAAQSWQQLLMINPEQQDAIAGLARIAKLQGRNAEAEAYLTRLRRANPASAAVKEIEGIGTQTKRNPAFEAAGRLAASGQTEQALEAYRNAFGGTIPPPEVAIAYYETLAATAGGWEKATAGLEDVLRRNPGSQEIRMSLGRLYTYRPATRTKGLSLLESVSGASAAAARVAWRQALVWEAGAPRSADSLRAYLAQHSDPELQTLAEKAQRAPAQAPHGGEDVMRAYRAMKKDDLGNAEKLFAEALKRNPRDPAALSGMGFLRMKQQDFAGALESFDAAASVSPGDKAVREGAKEARFWIAMQQGGAALNNGRSDEAAAMFNKALTEKPNHVEALAGSAGALMQRSDYAKALPVLERLVGADPTRARGWRDLVSAKFQTRGAQAALDQAAAVPSAVATKLNDDLEYLALMAGTYQRTGNQDKAKKTFERAAAIAERVTEPLPVYLEVQLGALYLQFEDPAMAAKHYYNAVNQDATNLSAWEGFLIASNRAGAPVKALQFLETLPVSVHEAAQARPSFLRAVAALESRAGNVSSAESLVDRAREIETAGGKDASFYTQIQMAQIWLDQGKGKEAADRFASLTQAYPANEEVWKGLVIALHKSGAFDQAAEQLRRMPHSVSNALSEDPDYISTVAALFEKTRSSADAAQFLRNAATRLDASGRTLPPALTIQLGWLLLDTQGSERELFVLLRNAKTRTDYTVQDRRSLDDIWTAWLTRSADAAKASGDLKHAIGILESGIRMLPAEVRLQRALAATLLSAGDAKRATAIYQAAGLNTAPASDYVAAIGAAMAAGDTRLTEAWLLQGLANHGKDTDLLSLAGKRAAAAGDFKRAEGFWRLALKQVDEQEKERLAASLRSGPGGIADLRTGDPSDEAGTLLLSRATGHEAPRSASPVQYRLPWNKTASTAVNSDAEFGVASVHPRRSDSARTSEGKMSVTPGLDLDAPASRIAVPTALTNVSTDAGPTTLPASRKESLARMLAAVQTPETQAELKRSLHQEMNAPANREPGRPFDPRSKRIQDLLPSESPISLAALLEPRTSTRVPTPESAEIMDRIKAVEGRNSPYAGLGGGVVSRNGQAGFERMMLQEATLESSTVMNGSIRTSVVARSVFADAAGPDGLSLYRFGMLPQGDTFSAPSVSGLAAEAQISGNNFGLRFGATPRGFPVRNFVGGFRVRPGGGPIVLTFDRDSVKDTILSYAGAQDPVSRRIWGGVIANSGMASGNFGGEDSGVYFNLGFQHITGDSVQTNRRIDGTVGSYWRLARTAAGSLNAGVNLFTMHYSKNLRYFTMGHGGYFSPQRFLLFNVPVTWSGKSKRLEYIVGTSIGSQSFSENASPYFPMDPLVQGTTGPYYPALSSSGVNYNIDFRTAYQVAENWFLVGYLNVNNARFYSQQSAGVSIRYSFRARPLDSDLSVPSIPDWRGRQPFGLR